MYCIMYILFLLFTHFILRIGCVPSGLKIGSVRDARNNEYPFIVRLESRITITFDDKISAENNVHLCTGVALGPTWSLTAGHCIDSASPMKDLTDNLKIQTVIRYGSSYNSSVAKVTSTVLHPSFHDPLLRMQNDIGLLRTEPIPLQKFAVLSTIDINTLGGYDVTLAGHTNTNGSLKVEETDYSFTRTPPQLLNAFVVRYESKNESTLPKKCVANRCVSSSSRECDGDSGGPMLHASGVVGIITISLENIRRCSAVNANGLVRMEFITPTRPHVKWINETLSRDAK